jgi:hypothetical protein
MFVPGGKPAAVCYQVRQDRAMVTREQVPVARALLAPAVCERKSPGVRPPDMRRLSANGPVGLLGRYTITIRRLL